MLTNFLDLYAESPMLYTYWVVAIVASVIFAFQAISLFVGFDTDTDLSGGDVDFDVDGLNLVSVKTVACFLLGFGWTGALCHPHIASPVVLGLLAFGVGLAFMVLIALLLRSVLRLSQNNSFRIEQTIGQTAEVYLAIPEGHGALGKITVSINGSLRELLALNPDGTPIATGAKVRITAVVDSQTVAVSFKS